MANEPSIAHIVFFTLKEPTRANIDALIASCHEHLTDHPGTLFYAAGPRGEGFTRPVNDADFHVGLHVVFDSRASHDTYQSSPRHTAFLAANQQSWAQVRVFDSMV